MSLMSTLWTICGLSLLLAVLASAITFHPDIQYLGRVLPTMFGGIGMLAGGTAIGLRRFSASHRFEQTKLLWIGLVWIAVLGTLFLVLAG